MAVIVDHTNRRVLEVLEGRDQAVVTAWLRQARERGLLGQVEEVTIDMWDAYENAAREVFGETVRVTADRFHVMKNFQDQLQNARRQIQNALPAEQAAELKGTRWLWVTNAENLSAEQRLRLTELTQRFPELGRLVAQRESLRELFEDRGIRDAETGKSRLRAWMEQAKALGLKALDRFCSTLTNWLEEIANYFVGRSSNGRTEGLNHGLRSILWRAFGMANFKHFRLRALDLFG